MADTRAKEYAERHHYQALRRLEQQSASKLEAKCSPPHKSACHNAPFPTSLMRYFSLNARGVKPAQGAVLRQMQQNYGNRAVQRYLARANNAGLSLGDENIVQRIQAKAGNGSRLDAGVQRELESALGADLSNVRVHADRDADEMARAVDAVAFTTGQDMFFRDGAYDPRSSDGLWLLAHEAAHTVQQAHGPVAGTPGPAGVSISDPSDSFEQAAERAADHVMSGKPATVQPQRTPAPSASASLQRYPMSEGERDVPEERWEQKQPLDLQTMPGKTPEEEEQPSARTLPGAAPVQRMPADSGLIQRLTAEEKTQDLQSDKYKGNARLQSAFDNNPAMHIGETGDAVRLVQEGLRGAGFAMPGSTKSSGDMDGIFGPETFNTIKAFQIQNGLEPDGIVGRNTIGRLDALALGPGPGPIPGTGPSPGPPPPPARVPVAITGGTELWHFNGSTPANYPLQQTLTANAGGTAGVFTWSIVTGAAFADFNGSAGAVGASATLKSKLPSGALNDVQIKVDFLGAGGQTGSATLNFTVRAPDSLNFLRNVDSASATFVYNTQIHYSILDQLGTVLPRTVPINEHFTAAPTADVPGMDWRRGAEGNANVNPSDWFDNVDGETPGHTPAPVPPGNANAGVLVYHWPGTWQVGSNTIGSGRRVASITWSKSRGHARHT